MAFFESILSKNETLLSKTRIHWWAYVRGVFFLLIGLIILGSKFNIFLSALYYIGVFFLIWAITRSYYSEIAITNRRILLRTGVIRIVTSEFQLNKLVGLSIVQGLFGRILNFGYIRVTEAGQSKEYGPFPDPFDLKKRVDNAVEEYVKQ